MNVKKIWILVYTLVFCLALGTSALADDHANLIAWSSSPAPVSSDPANTADQQSTGPYSNGEGLDVAMMTCTLKDDHHLQVTIGPNSDDKEDKAGGAYPGYQAYVTAAIVNTTSDLVKITGVTVTGPHDVIKVDIADSLGNSLTGRVLNANEKVPVKVTTTVTDSAAQDNEYTFDIQIDAVQETVPGGGPSGGGGGGSGLPERVFSSETATVQPNESVSSPAPGEEPQGPQEEPVEVPSAPAVMSQLPYTGGNIALFCGAGLILGCMGIYMRRRR